MHANAAQQKGSIKKLQMQRCPSHSLNACFHQTSSSHRATPSTPA